MSLHNILTREPETVAAKSAEWLVGLATFVVVSGLMYECAPRILSLFQSAGVVSNERAPAIAAPTPDALSIYGTLQKFPAVGVESNAKFPVTVAPTPVATPKPHVPTRTKIATAESTRLES